MLEQKCYDVAMKPELELKLSKKYAGRLGGLRGGKARAEKLSDEERKAIARKGAEARWGKLKTPGLKKGVDLSNHLS